MQRQASPRISHNTHEVFVQLSCSNCWVLHGFTVFTFPLFQDRHSPPRAKKRRPVSLLVVLLMIQDGRPSTCYSDLFSMSLASLHCKFALQAAGSWYSTIAAVIILAVLGGIGYMVVTGHLRHSWPTSDRAFTSLLIYNILKNRMQDGLCDLISGRKWEQGSLCKWPWEGQEKEP